MSHTEKPSMREQNTTTDHSLLAIGSSIFLLVITLGLNEDHLLYELNTFILLIFPAT